MTDDKLLRRYRMNKFSKSDRQNKRITFPYCERCCGNCACFNDEDVFGKGLCFLNDGIMDCDDNCDNWVADTFDLI